MESLKRLKTPHHLGEKGSYLLPPLGLGGRDSGILKPLWFYSHKGQKLLEELEPTAGVVVSFCIVTIAGVAARNKHTIYPF